jgi:hypothetical protein
MLAVDPQQEFRGNGDDAGNRMQPWLLGAQQQAERQSGDERRAQIKRNLRKARTDELGEEACCESGCACRRAGAKVDDGEIDREKGGERDDLKVTRIRPD